MSAPAPTRPIAEEASRYGPYVGLRAYREEDADFFFSRDEESEIVAANLLASRLTVLYGASGVGKTSLLRAGVVPRLRRRGTGSERRGAVDLAVVVVRSWKDDPVTSILDEVRLAISSRGTTEEPEPPDATGSLIEGLERWTNLVGGDILLVLDQFEDYLLYHRDDPRDDAFGSEFAELLRRPDARVNALISLREDALAGLDRFKRRIPGLFQNILRIDRLDRAEGQQAIEAPLDRFNAMRPSATPIGIEPSLVSAVLDQVAAGRVVLGPADHRTPDLPIAHDGDQRIEAPYLQLVMSRIWDEEVSEGSDVLRRATLAQLGESQRIVRTHLDTIMDRLDAEERSLAASVFRHLVTASGTKIAHSASDLSEFVAAPEPKIASILDRLSDPDARVIRPVAPPTDRLGETRFEIYHDALVPAVIDWRNRYRETRGKARARRRWSIVAVGMALLIGATVWSGLAYLRLRARSNPDLVVVRLQPGLVVVRNVGEDPSGPFAVTMSSTGQELRFADLPVGDEEAKSFPCVAGRVTATIDPRRLVHESEDANNSFTGEFTCDLPDLTIVIRRGALGVRNDGRVPAGTFFVTVAGQPNSATFSLPNGRFLPIHGVEDGACVFADSTDSVLELDESNNDYPRGCAGR